MSKSTYQVPVAAWPPIFRYTLPQAEDLSCRTHRSHFLLYTHHVGPPGEFESEQTQFKLVISTSFVVGTDDTISAAVLVETYSSSTQYLLDFLSTNTRILYVCIIPSSLITYILFFHLSLYKSSNKTL